MTDGNVEIRMDFEPVVDIDAYRNVTVIISKHLDGSLSCSWLRQADTIQIDPHKIKRLYGGQ